MKKVYYAHHVWKYGTEIEAWELDLIRQFFDRYKIINPRDAIEQGRPEENIMADCLQKVKECDAFVFSSLSGVIGKGVYREIRHAARLGRPAYYLHHGRIEEAKNVRLQTIHPQSDRAYAAVWL